MTKKKDSTILSVLHPVCCGLDVHKKTISACIVSPDKNGEPQTKEWKFN